MIFTSYTYVVFLAVAFVCYWLTPRGWRKPVAIAASYAFYCSWRWEFGFLLLAVTLFNWAYARWVLSGAGGSSGRALALGIAVNVGLLGYFKYTGFVVANANALLHALGAAGGWRIPEILLPLGISFFTFQGVAYLVDVAAGDEPLASLGDFMLFKSFWPQLIAGPIVRLNEMREQLETPRVLAYDDVAAGATRILQGFCKKVVVADQLAPIVETAFRIQGAGGFVDCVVGTVAFGMQIYFDFSAYSDIAIGSARLLGYELPENFDWPYLSRSPSEFWRRWHMSLSRWIRDYVFTPLTFATRTRPRLAPVWLLLAMALCGLWHGANWTFVVWGLWHGALLALNQVSGTRLFASAEVPHSLVRGTGSLVLTFVLVQVGWILFRAPTLAHAGDMLRAIVTFRHGFRPSALRENAVLFVGFVFGCLALVHLLRPLVARIPWHRPSWRLTAGVLKPVLYAGMIIAVIVADQEARPFVYFQF